MGGGKAARHHKGLSDAPTEKVTQKYYLKRHHPKSFRRWSKALINIETSIYLSEEPLTSCLASLEANSHLNNVIFHPVFLEPHYRVFLCNETCELRNRNTPDSAEQRPFLWAIFRRHQQPDYIPSNRMIMDEWCIAQDFEGSGHVLIEDIYFEELSKTTKHFGPNSDRSVRDSNQAPPEYESLRQPDRWHLQKLKVLS